MNEALDAPSVPDPLPPRARLGGERLARWLAPTAETRVERIPVESIDDRKWGEPDRSAGADFAALRDSIALRGMIEPVILRRHGQGRYQLVCGERRLRAARELGHQTVPAMVRDLGDAEALLAGGWAVIEKLDVPAADRAVFAERLTAAGLDPAEAEALVSVGGSPPDAHGHDVVASLATPSGLPLFTIAALASDRPARLSPYGNPLNRLLPPSDGALAEGRAVIDVQTVELGERER